MDRVHSFEEVKKHNVKDDCWIIISGKVYNVTPFMEEHPGGCEVLIAVTGKDATEDFEEVGHSYVAKERMTKFFIGTIDSSTIPAKRNVPPPPSKVASPTKQNSGGSANMLLIFIPLLIMGLALAYQKFGKVA